ncbi:MAG: hypothetical protein JXR52_03235 [Bacteroidales bacterium]|nr:hypothetical protein [Bacteroidales bacterium]MBN2697810.1 hypothetical protein [Bacteroidales bacterium]
MSDFIRYIIELNFVLSALFLTYSLAFRKDRNFLVRRYALLLIPVISVIIPLLPSSFDFNTLPSSILSFTLDEITISGKAGGTLASSSVNPVFVFSVIYYTVLILGLIKLLVHLLWIKSAVKKSEKIILNGQMVLSNRIIHASSFFKFIFIDLFNNRKDSVKHILEHELVHRDEKHSADRILTEIVVILCWFNPLAYLFKRAVIENHEYIADASVIRKGANRITYQISLLNQYIESASITNQFSSQIKKRIKMLNVTYKMGSRWKIAILLPTAVLAFFMIACANQNENAPDDMSQAENTVQSDNELPGENNLPGSEAQTKSDPLSDDLFYIVEEMPKFQGGSPDEFRKFIAENVKYPQEAAKNGVTGKIFVRFIVTKTGKVVIPDSENLAELEGKPLDEVVVVSYRPLKEADPVPEEKYIELLKAEALRVVSSSPDWEPGRQRGKVVNVIFTFPISFVLQ